MSNTDDRVLIRHGANSWLIERTDRDAADRHAVIESAGQILCHWLNLCSPLGFRGIFQVLHQSAAGARLVIGAARPLLISVSHEPQPEPDAVHADPELGSSAIERHVLEIERSWIVRADFDWQASDTKIPWPYHAAHVLGSVSLNDEELDWLLVSARRPPPAERQSSPRGVHP